MGPWCRWKCLALLLLLVVTGALAINEEEVGPRGKTFGRFHAKKGTEVYHARLSKGLISLTFVHTANSNKFTVSQKGVLGVKKSAVATIKGNIVAIKWRGKKRIHKYVLTSERGLMQISRKGKPQIMFFAEISATKLPSTVKPTNHYMLACREVLDSYMFWTSQVVAGETVKEFPGVTSWKDFRGAGVSAVKALQAMIHAHVQMLKRREVLLNAKAKARVANEQNMLKRMSKALRGSYDRISYWHDFMHKAGVDQPNLGEKPSLTDKQLNSIFTPKLRAMVKKLHKHKATAGKGNKKKGTAGKPPKKPKKPKKPRSPLRRNSNRRKPGRRSGSLLEVQKDGDDYAKDLEKAIRKGLNNGAKGFMKTIYKEIDKKEAEAAKDWGGKDSFKWYLNTEKMRFDALRKNLKEQKIEKTFEDAAYSTLVSDEFVSKTGHKVANAEKKVKSWGTSLGNFFMNLVKSGDSVKKVNKDVKKKGGLQPGDKQLASNAFEAASAKRAKALAADATAIENGNAPPSSSKKRSKSGNPAKNPKVGKDEKKGFRIEKKLLKVKPKFALKKGLLTKVSITNKVALYEGNNKHELRVDFDVEDPFVKDKASLKAKANWKSQFGTKFQAGAGVEVMVAGIREPQPHVKQVLLSAFVAYNDGKTQTGLFASVTCPYKKGSDGKVVAEPQTISLNPYYRRAFNDDRTSVSLNGKVKYIVPTKDIHHDIDLSMQHSLGNGKYIKANYKNMNDDKTKMNMATLAVGRQFQGGFVEVFGGHRERYDKGSSSRQKEQVGGVRFSITW